MTEQGLQPKDFQRATVDRLARNLLDGDGDRMLVADEVGLGKTIVAKEFIKEMLLRRTRLSVIYVCNNQQIARQNLRKLNVTGLAEAYENHDRLTLAFSQRPARKQGLRLLGLSPQTSLSKRSRGGTAHERLFLLYLLRHFKKLYRRKGVLSRFLRLDVSKESWKSQRKWRTFDPPKGLIADFKRQVRATGLYDRLTAHFDERLHLKKKNNRALIGALRQVLIEVSIDRMRPDLIVLDEFQRFRELLAGESDGNEAAQLARRLFLKERVKILLLSATPYRMYVQRAERARGEDHYADFRFLIHFLLGHHPDKTAAYDRAWTRYQQTIDGITPEILRREKELGDQGAGPQVQRMLRSMVCRTERASLLRNEGRGVMLTTASEHELVPTAVDLLHYRSGEQLAEGFRRAGHWANSPLSYYKSAPYPFSFMEGYKISRLWRKAEAEDQARIAAADCWLPLDRIARYLPIDHPNAAFRYLLNHSLAGSGENLLWVPPAQPDYPLAGAFAGQVGYSKTLLFSHWRLVPRAVATLLSYEAERRPLSTVRNQRASFAEVGYFAKDGQESRANPFRFETTDRKLHHLTYPSRFLAALPLPRVANLATLIAEIEDLLLEKFRAFRLFDDGAGSVDDDWYWQLPILLDQAAYGGEVVATRLESALAQAASTTLAERFAPLLQLLRTPRRELIDRLGRPPADLLEVVARQTVGSPAVATLRMLISQYSTEPADEAQVLADSLRVADAFRRFFNRPDSALVVRANRPANDAFPVLNYCLDGNLSAMLREYYHVVTESQALHQRPPAERNAAFATELGRAISLNTSSPEVFHPAGSRRLRTHFAVGFLSAATDDKQQQREGDVRSAFNSPFRPFVLASTSVGQEGLDFHYYARHLVHWNLPHNPVDMEQREGRINRYKNHAVRLGLAHRYGSQIDQETDFWSALFAHAHRNKPAGTSDLIPFWHLGAAARKTPFPIVRHAPHLPFSKDARQLEDLLRTLPLYRLVLGMPDQEGLITMLQERFSEEEARVFGEVFGMDLG